MIYTEIRSRFDVKLFAALSILCAVQFTSAEVHDVVARTYYDTFFHGHPVLKRIKPGDTVRTKTLDVFAGDEKGVKAAELVNALTGPFYVEGAEPRDAIISIGSQPEFNSSFDQALRMATVDMVRWLTTDYGLEPWAAHILVSMQVRYQVVTVAGSMALKIPKRYLP